uniref:Protein kinase domain-containing protein n=1 Tax=Anabas testudineus TaxID=64144 RepID=A0AAQ6IJL9_ANATE
LHLHNFQLEMKMALQVKERDILHSDSTRYLVMNFSGEGCFGKVAKCLDLVTAKMAAVKILKKGEEHFIQSEALKGLGIMHTDLKPDNVMLVNHKDKPFKIKLIDFGLALPEWQVQPGVVIQPFSYRAPEVTLGLPLSTAVDMWGVGFILHLLGQPDHWHLHSGKNVWKYFTRDPSNPKWRLRTPTEYEVVTGIKPQETCNIMSLCRDLEHLVQMNPKKADRIELKDRMAFLSLLKCCLHVNSAVRMTPRLSLRPLCLRGFPPGCPGFFPHH